jgi:hypothetical protein
MAIDDLHCLRCFDEMTIGIAIDPGKPRRHCFPHFHEVSNYWTLKIIEVMKCPSCGYSDDGTIDTPEDFRRSYHPTDNSKVMNSVVDYFASIGHTE